MECPQPLVKNRFPLSYNIGVCYTHSLSKTLKFHTHSPKHEITCDHSIHGPLTSISYLVTLFYPPFAFLLWIEVKTTAGKNLFSIQSKSSY